MSGRREANSTDFGRKDDQQAGHVNSQSEDQSSSSTPVQIRKMVAVEVFEQYSPIYSQCTQDDGDNVDVMWDWYSPQSKPRVRKQKRIDTHKSPKLPIKRHPSNNQVPVFDKLKEELETLRDKIVSEHTETETGTTSNAAFDSIQRTKHIPSNFKNLDVFDDSMEEQLLVCSQQAEHDLNRNTENVEKIPPTKKQAFLCNNNNNAEPVKDLAEYNYVSHQMNSNSSNKIKNDPEDEIVAKYLKPSGNNIADDSFDCILETLKDEDLNISKQTSNKGNLIDIHPQNKEQFIDKSTLQKIEHKRKEALAKLETKKKQSGYESESPIKCSPEEIEKKRLQALAKLQAKKQSVIERNRQQALQRLEMSKRKRVLQAQAASKYL